MTRNEILNQHYKEESERADDEKLWSGLWHATIPNDFLVVACHEKFNGSVWAVYAYITTRMDMESGKSRNLRNEEICDALKISLSTLDRAKATLKEFFFISEDDGDGSVYHAKDIEVASERAKNRQIRKRKEAKLKQEEAAIAEEEAKLKRSMSMREREDFIKEKFNRKYNPSLI